MTELGKKIIKLKKEDYSYDKIMKELNCSKSTISYYLGENQKEKAKERNTKRKSKPEFVLQKKLYEFRYRNNTGKKVLSKVRDFQRREGSKLIITKPELKFNIDDFLLKIGNEPKCYLSGELIDLYDTKSYCIDHIIPSTKGGENTLENAGLVSSTVNKMKSDIFIDELIENCVKILEHNGYIVIKK
jgi:CRISPR/Cas system Type II protein with McrA/HNH and RuvC-like nuclease domain